MTFSEKLVKLRKMKGLTQDEFASAVGVSRQAVYKWECGQSYPEAMKLVEIKMLFNISIDDLLDDTYEVIVPEKKRKRISKEEAAAVKTAVEEETNVPVEEPKAEEPKEDVKEEPKEEPKAEEPVAEEPKEEVKEEAPAVEEKAEEKAEAPTEEKPAEPQKPERVSLFERLFGRK